MKFKKIFTVLVMMFLIMAICVQATDHSYLHDYKWKVLFKCYDDGCIWIWEFCKSVCINNDGYIYNKNNNTKIGEWSPGTGIGFNIIFYSDCGQLNGTIFFEDSPSAGMDGQGYSYLWGKRKAVKIFLVREEPMQTTSKKM